MKSLLIRDSGPISRLELRLYNVCTRRESNLSPDHRGPFALEAMPPGAKVELEILYRGDQLKRDGEYNPSGATRKFLERPDNLAQALSFFGARVAEVEKRFYLDVGRPDMARFFGQPNLLPVGFGTGWNAKTVGCLLDEGELRQAGVSFRYGQPPPVSRRVCLDGHGNYAIPLGWGKLTLEET